MPRPKSVRRTRTCLVCGSSTSVAHLGLDICRACTVFYRRSRDREFACRSNTDNCAIGEGVNCRKCRMAELVRMLSAQPNRAEIGEMTAGPSTHTEETNEGPDHTDCASPSTSSKVPQNCEMPKQRDLLEKLRQCYRTMCDSRLAGESAARKHPLHPLEAVDGNYEIIPATFAGMENANRIFLTTLLQFGASAFAEFGTFPAKERWIIVSNFFSRYRMFETCYRADKAFPDDFTRTFAGYTMYFAKEVADKFLDDCKNDMTYRKEANRGLRASFNRDMVAGRTHMRRVNLREEEFLAVLCIMFWATDGLELGEDVARASRTYKEQILKELHSYYREQLQQIDYAARLGELLLILQIYEERSVGLKQNKELLRLLNVYTDNTFIYNHT